MSQSSCQFIYFRVKSSVKPEDVSSEEGQALLDVFRMTKHQSGHQSSAWGRTSEDQDIIVWVLDWNDPRSSTDLNLLDQFLAVDNAQPPTSVYVTLSPPISATATLTQNPVTELCTLPYASTLSVLEAKQLNADLISFRTALMEQMPQVASPRSWAMGQLDRPCKLDHAHSPSGKATVHFLAVGWDSVDAHLSAKETAKFSEGVAPLMEKMLAPIPGLEMNHVSFQKV
ncbi:hypothetical protein MYU51_004227 [Penicillium brevicompactum]|uniref:uncharacterized protein n=1 Tax=Penicillium brevicompactum TaxID=5074 RepID=UPI002540B782|nr:uncharacterized protein N7506_000578 [Penicillium brevicompactum]KAJ5347325.1 hypothetical protein N7506_000578 [Penicillium brevicompactum]